MSFNEWSLNFRYILNKHREGSHKCGRCTNVDILMASSRNEIQTLFTFMRPLSIRYNETKTS